ncbi:hypothetical protein CSA17_04135 [bacterium DOLJORAL78_65_58]|nr:MAG: hypothetical protein CSB20_02835 [bacterium DOLZORAL124_64_63]PIE76076.1 MAG: hypothetical protein CSA17_04135 [bacterium DOLJORAL78_65_58]
MNFSPFSQGPYWPPAGIKSRIFQARFPDSATQLARARQARDGQIVFWQPWDMEMTHTPRRLKHPIAWGHQPLGDVEWPHSLARFPFMVDLAFGFARTGQPRYREQWERIFQDYRHDRAKGRPFWDHSLDTAIRSVRIVQSWDIMVRHSPREQALQQQVIADLEASQIFLLSRLGSSVGNWEFIICSSLLLVAAYLGADDHEPAPAAALARLAEIKESEINADGLEVEFAPMYQGVIILFLLEMMAGRHARGRPTPSLVLEILDLLMPGLKSLCRPDGRVPAIGDSDPMPFTYLENLWQTIADQDQQSAQQAPQAPQTLRENQPPSPPSTVHLKATNVLIMNRILGDNLSQLVFDAAGLPPARRRWHSHEDDLQVLLSMAGRPIWIDPGRFTYTQHFRHNLPGSTKTLYPQGRWGFLYRLTGARTRDLVRRDWRRHFQSRAVHNVMHCLDPAGRERPLTGGAIQPLRHTTANGLRVAATSFRDEDGYQHCRWILATRSQVLLLDGVRSPDPARWAGHFLFPEDIDLEDRAGEFIIGDKERGPFLVQTFREVGAAGLGAGIIRGWCSPQYNLKRRTTVLTLQSPPVREWVVVTVLSRWRGPEGALTPPDAFFEGADLVLGIPSADPPAQEGVRVRDFWAATGVARPVEATD